MTSFACSTHKLETGAYCTTCNILLCSACAIKFHKTHDVSLLEDIDQTERQQLKETISSLKHSIKEWEDSCHTQDDQLNQEFFMIQHKQKALLQGADATFTALMTVIQARHEEIRNKINQVAESKAMMVLSLKQLKSQTNTKLEQFDQIDNLSTLEVMQLKMENLAGVNQSLIEMRSCFDNQTIESLHSFTLANIVPQADLLCGQIKRLGDITDAQLRNSMSQSIINNPTTKNLRAESPPPKAIEYSCGISSTLNSIFGENKAKTTLEPSTSSTSSPTVTKTSIEPKVLRGFQNGNSVVTWIVPDDFVETFEKCVKKFKSTRNKHQIHTHKSFKAQSFIYDHPGKTYYCVKTTSRIDENIFKSNMEDLFINPTAVIALYLNKGSKLQIPFENVIYVPFTQQITNGKNELEINFNDISSLE